VPRQYGAKSAGHMLDRMMLAGVPVTADSVEELARIVRSVGAAELADRLERALRDEVKLLGVEIDERTVILNAVGDPPDGLAELCSVLMSDHQWRRRGGLDP
jgi:hypothetical protein